MVLIEQGTVVVLSTGVTATAGCARRKQKTSQLSREKRQSLHHRRRRQDRRASRTPWSPQNLRCFRCFPTRPWPADTCPRFLRFLCRRVGMANGRCGRGYGEGGWRSAKEKLRGTTRTAGLTLSIGAKLITPRLAMATGSLQSLPVLTPARVLFVPFVPFAWFAGRRLRCIRPFSHQCERRHNDGDTGAHGLGLCANQTDHPPPLAALVNSRTVAYFDLLPLFPTSAVTLTVPERREPRGTLARQIRPAAI
jgi:hypothetical protein